MNPSLNAALFHFGKHLRGNQMYDAIGECPICLSNERRDNVISLQTDPDVILLGCRHCGGVSSSKMPTEETLDEYYKSYYAKDAKKLTFHDVSRLAKHIFNSIDDTLFLKTEIIRILDFGGGDGSLAMGIGKLIGEVAVGRNVEVVLIDFNSDTSYKDGGVSLIAHKNISEVSGVFHIILASAILEHIPKLNAIVLDLISKLSSGGYFYARTPYVVPFKKMFKTLDFTFPAHVHDLGPSFWNQFKDTFLVDWKVIFSQSSIVETQFHEAFMRTFLAYIFKFPSRLEGQFSSRIILRPYWKYVGGWEVLFCKKEINAK